MSRYLAGIATAIAILTLAGCSNHGATQASVLPQSGDVQAFKSSLSLIVEPDPTLGPAQAVGFELQCEQEKDGCLVRIVARDAVRLKSFYCSLSYDGSSLHPVSARPGPALGPASRVLSLARNDTGRLHFGEVIVHPQAEPGFSGDGVLAEIHFSGSGSGLPVQHSASAVPDTYASSSYITWNQGTATLNWYYANQGDYDQNGEVNLADLTPLGIHFGAQGPFAHSTALSVVDGDGNGEINLADITPISLGFTNDCLGGYKVYATVLPSDYPQSPTEAPSIGTLDSLAWASAAGNPGADRLSFQYVVPGPVPNTYYWVRPVSSQAEQGTPSPMVGGNAADMPVIGITNPPASGSGTEADPYIFDPDTAYIFTMNSMSLGDLTTDPSTEYFLSDEKAGVISTSDATLAPSYPFMGALQIWGVYDHMRSMNTIFATVHPYYSWNLNVIDDGGVASNSVGQYCGTTCVDDEPYICYYDGTDKNLKFARWIPPLWPLPGDWQVMIVDAAGDVGEHCSITNMNNIAMITYYDQTQRLLKCAVATTEHPLTTADWAIHTIQDTIEVSGTSFAPIGVLPAVAYSDLGHNHLHYARATNALPSAPSDWVVQELDAWGTSENPALHSVNGKPGLAFTVFPTHQLRYARATSTTPSSDADWLVMTVDAISNVGGVSLNNIEGLQPAILYNDSGADLLKYATGVIDPVAGDAWNVVIADGEGEPSSSLSFTVVNGRFCLAYNEMLDNALHFARTNWPYPTERNWQRTLVDSANGSSGSVSIGAFGPFNAQWPGIAYQDSNEDLRFAFGYHF